MKARTRPVVTGRPPAPVVNGSEGLKKLWAAHRELRGRADRSAGKPEPIEKLSLVDQLWRAREPAAAIPELMEELARRELGCSPLLL